MLGIRFEWNEEKQNEWIPSMYPILSSLGPGHSPRHASRPGNLGVRWRSFPPLHGRLHLRSDLSATQFCLRPPPIPPMGADLISKFARPSMLLWREWVSSCPAAEGLDGDRLRVDVCHYLSSLKICRAPQPFKLFILQILPSLCKYVYFFHYG